ncbi:uncharacterized protein EV154DRAFT_268247 [Mucor mucedo]|uniref:uncharacterized protein n=1 Tax=Mucor mucedo TaxID=29922 RepID=UPI00221F2672|nr:uncharacterized protein EV154DRAFT_268247 [Mucor mucedo]KAI7889881.1 hypothetical protein EV154DRAFT_268247 [Mucor mucedo]
MARFHPALEASFHRLEEKNKWILSTGKVVEDVLNKLSKSCLVDHPSCSMILDLDDKTYIKEGLFTQEEIVEMKQKNLIGFVDTLPTDLANYINGFNCDNAKELRAQLLKVQDWEHIYDSKKYHDFDWVKHTIFSFVRLYESGNLKKIQKETWYNSHVWSLIDTIFDDIDTLHVIRGEAANAASTRRKNMDRVIGSKDKIARAFTGYKCDLIVREEKADHEYADEYGVGETAIHHLNTKTIEEKGIKLPKVMKDMLDKLVTSNQNEYQGLSIFGIQTSGLSITLLAADKPTPYITRISKIKDLSVSSDISHFTRSILPLIVLIWQFKQQILKVKKKVSLNQKRNYPKDNSEWLNTCLEYDNVVIMPVTSTSTEYVNKRRKHYA